MAGRMTKRAFTLVELLVVTGIIAAMATIGIGSYGAIQRGMADRGALAAATSVISLAQNRARIDMEPTVVYFMNELIQSADDNAGTVARVAGVAIAIRRAGRVTRKGGTDLIFDEFGDLEHSYPTSKDTPTSKAGFKLYRFNLSGAPQYSEVRNAVVRGLALTTGGRDDYWCLRKPRNTADLDHDDGLNDGDIRSYAFSVINKNKDHNSFNWGVGDAYGYEFVRIRLPDNYVFGSGSRIPTKNNPVEHVETHAFYPSAGENESLWQVEVSSLRTDGNYKSIGRSEGTIKEI